MNKKCENAQRETTLRPPLRWRRAMGEPLTSILNCEGYGTATAMHRFSYMMC